MSTFFGGLDRSSLHANRIAGSGARRAGRGGGFDGGARPREQGGAEGGGQRERESGRVMQILRGGPSPRVTSLLGQRISAADTRNDFLAA